MAKHEANNRVILLRMVGADGSIELWRLRPWPALYQRHIRQK